MKLKKFKKGDYIRYRDRNWKIITVFDGKFRQRQFSCYENRYHEYIQILTYLIIGDDGIMELFYHDDWSDNYISVGTGFEADADDIEERFKQAWRKYYPE